MKRVQRTRNSPHRALAAAALASEDAMKIIHAQAVIGKTDQGDVVQELPHTRTTIDLSNLPMLQAGIPLVIEWAVTGVENVVSTPGLALKETTIIRRCRYI